MDLPLILDHRQEIEARIDRAGHLLLFLDFDGTLAPIVPRARAGGAARSHARGLERAGRDPGDHDLDRQRPLAPETSSDAWDRRPDLCRQPRSRNRGKGPRFRASRGRRAWSADSPTSPRGFAARARDSRGDRDRVERVDDLGALSRGRRVRPRSHLERLLRSFIPPDDPRIEVREGKMVHEIRPRVAWDKGHAVRLDSRSARSRRGAADRGG